ncbi:hypothetical protein BaRGS_00006008 [Batillaria attramentaria]|uniref:Uncharacterized protein n=1 Tax=Batillaria attramentaria TaxID=370345 RepID=A0ABD0LUH5_9CAEN
MKLPTSSFPCGFETYTECSAYLSASEMYACAANSPNCQLAQLTLPSLWKNGLDVYQNRGLSRKRTYVPSKSKALMHISPYNSRTGLSCFANLSRHRVDRTHPHNIQQSGQVAFF